MSEGTANLGQPAGILLVDDDPSNLQALASCLSSVGYPLSTAARLMDESSALAAALFLVWGALSVVGQASLALFNWRVFRPGQAGEGGDGEDIDRSRTVVGDGEPPPVGAEGDTIGQAAAGRVDGGDTREARIIEPDLAVPGGGGEPAVGGDARSMWRSAPAS